MPVMAAMAAVLGAMGSWSSPCVDGMVPTPGEVAYINLISQSPISNVYNKESFISYVGNWNPIQSQRKVLLNLEFEWFRRGDYNIFYGLILADDGMERVPDYANGRDIGLNKVSMTFYYISGKAAPIQDCEGDGWPSIARTWEPAKGLCDFHEEPRPLQISQSALGDHHTSAQPISLIEQDEYGSNGGPHQRYRQPLVPPFGRRMAIFFLLICNGLWIALWGVSNLDNKRGRLGTQAVIWGCAAFVAGWVVWGVTAFPWYWGWPI